MESSDHKGFLLDLVSEVVELTKDPSLYVAGDAYSTGYRSALYSVLHLIEQQAAAWDLDPEEVGLAGFSSDEWRKEGARYWGIEGGKVGKPGSENNF